MKFDRGQWVASNTQIGRINFVYDDGTLDIVLYERNGKCLGRDSPAMGGPTGFEPCCDPENWKQIKKPKFPLTKFAFIEEIVCYV